MVEFQQAHVNTKTFEARVCIAEDFPLTPVQMLPVARVLARTSQHFRNFANFFETKLPVGFPVAFDLPIVPAVTARVRFERVEVGAQLSAGEGIFSLDSAEFADRTDEFTAGTYFERLTASQ